MRSSPIGEVQEKLVPAIIGRMLMVDLSNCSPKVFNQSNITKNHKTHHS